MNLYYPARLEAVRVQPQLDVHLAGSSPYQSVSKIREIFVHDREFRLPHQLRMRAARKAYVQGHRSLCLEIE